MYNHNRCASCFAPSEDFAPTGETSACPQCGFIPGAPPKNPLYLVPGDILAGKYLLGRALGQGGFGITYLGWDINLDIKLAIKEFFPQGFVSRQPGDNKTVITAETARREFEYGIERFLSEAKTLARFEDHPNIVSVRDFFRENNTAYMIMTFVQGVTLEQYLQSKGGKTSFDQAMAVMMPVMDALREVHAMGFMHRDISPDNIIIDQRGRVILIDFGAARQEIREKSKSLSVILRAGYAPEEQYRSRGKQGPWTDVYAVGATIYRMVTGVVPPESMDRLVEDTIASPAELGASITAEQEARLLKALEVRAVDRDQSMAELQESLSAKTAAKNFAQSQTERHREEHSCVEEAGNGYRSDTGYRADTGYRSDTGYRADTGYRSEKIQVKKSSAPARGKKGLLISALVALAVLLVGTLVYLSGVFDFAPESTDRIDGSGETLLGSGENGDETAGDAQEETADSGQEGGGVDEQSSLFGAMRGNSIGNIVNVGVAAADDSYIYYRRTDHGGTDSAQGGALYRFDLAGNEHQRLTSDDAWNINVAGGWVYYSNRAANWHVYRVKTDGSERMRINSDDSGNLSVVGEWIYYRNDDDNGAIYKMRLDGRDRMGINNEQSFYLNVVGDYIYFQNRSDGGKIYRINTDGGGRVKINDHDSWNINVFDGWIYYSTPDEGWNIFKIKLDGSESHRVNRDDSGHVNVTKDWIYYRNDDDGGKLYRIRHDGTERTALNNEESHFSCIVKERVIYQNRNDDRRMYIMSLDGGNRRPLY